jgi:hypothetical protein
MNEIIIDDYFPGKDCHCEARSSYECGCDADWTPVEVYKLREDAKQLADRLTALELHSTSELARLERERDEARIDAKKSKAYKRVLKETNLRQTERIRYLEGATNHASGTPLSVALRERDEAREDLEFRRGLYKVQEQYLETASRERDEAREKYATEATEHMLAVNKLCGERDDARAALMRIEDLFIDCTDIYEDFKNMGMIAKAALEETK